MSNDIAFYIRMLHNQSLDIHKRQAVLQQLCHIGTLQPNHLPIIIRSIVECNTWMKQVAIKKPFTFTPYQTPQQCWYTQKLRSDPLSLEEKALEHNEIQNPKLLGDIRSRIDEQLLSQKVIELLPDLLSKYSEYRKHIHETLPILDLDDMFLCHLHISDICFSHIHKGTRIIHASFTNTQLYDMAFSQVQAVGVDFSGAKFIDCNIQNCDFSKANFTDTHLYGVSWQNCSLAYTTCEQTLVQACRLDAVNLGCIDFKTARLFSSNFNQSYCFNTENMQLYGCDVRYLDIDTASIQTTQAHACIVQNTPAFTHINCLHIPYTTINTQWQDAFTKYIKDVRTSVLWWKSLLTEVQWVESFSWHHQILLIIMQMWQSRKHPQHKNRLQWLLTCQIIDQHDITVTQSFAKNTT